jgi:precorrin-6B methylase 2
VKALVKRWVFGAGSRPRRIRLGLLRGLTFIVDPQEKSQRLLGLDEREIAAPVRRAADRGGTAIDIGCHDGWYATFFASRSSISKVLACDRNQVVLDLMMRNLNANQLASRVAVHRVSVGTFTDAGFRSLDDLLRHETPPFVIKIDVDGGELDVLTSGRTVLDEHDCWLIVETHSLALERECARYLQQLGYRTQVIANGWYRKFVPEFRPIGHNRWLVAARDRR